MNTGWNTQMKLWEQQFLDDEIKKEAEALQKMNDAELFNWCVSFNGDKFPYPDDKFELEIQEEDNDQLG
jgi:uncharacterized protein YprB with RNaseH-like and TPR domain